ncbi:MULTISPECIES: dihydrolipoyllysine-residue acetyltransferase [unclassified Luteibacter]|uniref:dihydrolipoyllysine-residue acetyltransferase n=1 Tax=unclassified Luteibacter TaxID=2620188 RepID=UPI0005B91589|nr:MULTISPECIES: dihydrolipoyllysine-residue acetyltransferase [unclassified Luteibacter]MDR6642950.1 pyruvate dehydrogenase E2 component (dihydrolipoamide acetyltransferase) [Luteibacter sp. 1214]
MADVKEARVPDIGGSAVPVIEIMVKVGDRVEKDQSLVTLESDKATMEVPAPFAGVIKELKVKVGDEVDEGHVIALVEAEGDAPAEAPRADAPKADAPKAAAPKADEAKAAAPAPAPAAAKAPSASKSSGPVNVTVPDIGGKPVPIIELMVKVGDTVEKDQSLMTLESDKATMDIPAPAAGVIRELKVKVGDEVNDGDLIAVLEGAGGESAEAASADAQPAASTDKPGISEAPAEAPKRAVASDASTSEASKSEPAGGTPRTPPVSFDASVIMPGNAPYASPAVRAFARELGVDVAQVKGSGRGGRIQREDISGYVKQVMASGASPSKGGAVAGGNGLSLLPWPKVDFSKFGDIEEKPLGRIPKISAANLARNWAMIPHVTQFEDADITELEAFRKKLGEENKDLKVTPLVFQIKAVVAALKKFPTFNASLDAAGEVLTLKKYYNVGIAVDTPDGLVVPVIRDADKKGLLELAAELGEISKKARDKKLTAADMSGGCFSISSLGGIGGTAFTPIVNAPEVAILGVSKAAMKPVWNGKEFAPRLILPLSLSYDHRVIDGALAARFAVYLAQQLGDIRRLLL